MQASVVANAHRDPKRSKMFTYTDFIPPEPRLKSAPVKQTVREQRGAMQAILMWAKSVKKLRIRKRKKG
jgi:hypothetical protein